MHLFPVNAKSALGLLGAALLAACSSGQTANPQPPASSVDTAYAALVSEVASCSKQAKSCNDAAGSDDAARTACRDQFSSCRATAGEGATRELANAVTACTSQHNACVRQGHGAAPACKDEFKACLRAAHPQAGQDEDGGVEEHGRGKSDCLDELHSCVEADGPANTCAEQVRSCVVDTFPSADELVPTDDTDDSADETDESAADDADEAADEADESAGDDADDAADEADDGIDEAAPGPDAGAGEQPAGSDDNGANAGKAKNGQAKGSARKAAAAQCLDAFDACVAAGGTQRDCAQSLKECRAAAR